MPSTRLMVPRWLSEANANTILEGCCSGLSITPLFCTTFTTGKDLQQATVYHASGDELSPVKLARTSALGHLLTLCDLATAKKITDFSAILMHPPFRKTSTPTRAKTIPSLRSILRWLHSHPGGMVARYVSNQSFIFRKHQLLVAR